MADRGLIFSAHSVRELLAGRKLRTRRVVTRTNSTADGYRWPADDWAELDFDAPDARKTKPSNFMTTLVDTGGTLSRPGNQYVHVPRPKWESRHRVRSVVETGDVIWVKETWSPDHRNVYPFTPIVYRADPGAPSAGELRDCMHDAPYPDCLSCIGFRWRSPIFMPRTHSRISMVVTEVRVERLQRITAEEVVLEGTLGSTFRPSSAHGKRTARSRFAKMWDEINGERPGAAWADNPWTWVICWDETRPGSAVS